MKIYLASGDKHTVKKRKRILLSYYDLELSEIKFRNKTFNLIKEDYGKSK